MLIKLKAIVRMEYDVSDDSSVKVFQEMLKKTLQDAVPQALIKVDTVKSDDPER